MAQTAENTWLVHGAVKRGVWCDIHSLPHILEYAVYSYSEPAPGYLNISLIRQVSKCDMR